MTRAALFWTIMLLWLLIGCGVIYPLFDGGRYLDSGYHALLFVLIALLGWQTYGRAIKD